MNFKKWFRQFSVKLEFKLQDFFIGFYWKTQKNVYGFNHLDLWILIIPTLPIHIHCLIGGSPFIINRDRDEINLTETILKINELSYDSAGRAYPPHHNVTASWNKIYEYKRKYYKIIGDEHHKEWSEISAFKAFLASLSPE